MTETNITNKELELIEKIDLLQLELEKISTESKNNWDSYIRCKAEIENIKKRTDKEILNITNFSLQNILTDFIPVLDSFDLCLNNKNETNSINIEGINLIYKMLLAILEKYNLKKIYISENEKLDSLKHEVISVIHDENIKEDDVINSVLQHGYMLHDRVIRYAKVSIIKRKI